MRSLIAKIAFTIIVLCLLTLVFGVAKPHSPSGTFQAASMPDIDDNASAGYPEQ